MRTVDFTDRNRDAFALPAHDVLVQSRLRAIEGGSAGPVLSLKWVLDGEERYAFGDRDVRLRPGELMLVPVGIARRASLRAPRDVVGRCLYLHAPTLQATAADELRAAEGVLLFPRAGDPLAPLLAALDAAPQAVAADAVARALAGSLAAHVAARDALPVLRLDRRESIHARLLRVRAHMHEHFDTPLPLSALAARACMSPFHFARHFRAAFGLPPHRYLLQLRLDTARARLATGVRPVGAVAADVGMPDVQGFGRAFRSRFGVAPGAVGPGTFDGSGSDPSDPQDAWDAWDTGKVRIHHDARARFS